MNCSHRTRKEEENDCFDVDGRYRVPAGISMVLNLKSPP